MSRETKTLAPADVNSMRSLLENISPCAPVLEALETFEKNQPTFTRPQLGVLATALQAHYPWKDLKTLYTNIGALPWS